MAEDTIFSVKMDPATRNMLQCLAAIAERKRGDVIRRLVRDAYLRLPESRRRLIDEQQNSAHTKPAT